MCARFVPLFFCTGKTNINIIFLLLVQSLFRAWFPNDIRFEWRVFCIDCVIDCAYQYAIQRNPMAQAPNQMSSREMCAREWERMRVKAARPEREQKYRETSRKHVKIVSLQQQQTDSNGMTHFYGQIVGAEYVMVIPIFFGLLLLYYYNDCDVDK